MSSLEHVVDTGALVRAAQGGDRAAFGELYALYAGMVHSIALARLGADDAADVVQEAFLRALRQLRRLRDVNAFGGWLAAIARNVIRDVQRLGCRRADADVEPAHRDTQHEDMQARTALRAIRALPAVYREPLLMRLVEGMTGPEIAHRTGLTPGSVRVNLHRGMKLLRRRLEAAGTRRRP
ncbi:MAG TPA: sigma-70 family RNA polymerase sigma factor [Vicinamibacterales bacterium]|nr:sigma-70 family RNA polymerase sigma factor [Vicinamibacterales bacterium]